MKKEDALNKWCPFVQVSNGERDEINNRGQRKVNSNSDYGSNCLGSGCMAWCEIVNSDNEGFCIKLT